MATLARKQTAYHLESSSSSSSSSVCCFHCFVGGVFVFYFSLFYFVFFSIVFLAIISSIRRWFGSEIIIACAGVSRGRRHYSHTAALCHSPLSSIVPIQLKRAKVSLFLNI